MSEKIYHVLIIHDEPDIREVMVSILKEHQKPLRVYEAKDGVEALSKIKNQQFDLIITDLHMPKMGGKELLQEMKTIHKDFRPKSFLVASGHVDGDILKEAKGAVSILKKPYSAETLVKYVDVILSASEQKPKKQSAAPVKKNLNVEFINPFIEAALEVLEIMCGTEAEKDFVFVKDDNETLGDISGLIAINSDKCVGSMAITFPEDVYLKIVSNMLGEEYTEINEENKDGVAEICNQIFGNAKAKLNQHGVFLDMTIPTIISGSKHTINHNVKDAKILGVYFKTDFGTFVIECVVVDKV